MESIKQLLLMAPIAGITEGAFRILARRGGADMVFTEMISARGIVFSNPKTLSMLKITPEERPISVQLFGDNPEIIAEAVRYVYRQVKPEGIDLNFSCPVARIRRSGSGVELLKDRQLLKAIVRAARRVAPDIILSAKIRPGIYRKENLLQRVVPVLEEAGVDRIIVHARYANDFHDGPADWSVIKEVVKMTSVSVIANGGIVTPQLARECLRQSGCAGVMIGRAAIGDWMIFQRIRKYLDNPEQNVAEKISLAERLKNLREHAQTIVEYYGRGNALRIIRSALPYYLTGFPRARLARRLIPQVETMEDIEKIISVVNGQ